MITPENIGLILFDVGGVLVEFIGEQKIREWTEGRLSRKELWHWYYTSSAVSRFETGKCNPQVFADSVIKELSLPLDIDQFLREFITWFIGPFPGTEMLLDRLARSYSLATLSNTNEIFWKKFADTELFDKFQMHFPSHEVGLLKPDPSIYQHVINSTGLLPEQILFIDDQQPNIDSAMAEGMNSIKVKGFAELKASLSSLGLLEP
jgi:putative hydrolase of the HAD superfamily